MVSKKRSLAGWRFSAGRWVWLAAGLCWWGGLVAGTLTGYVRDRSWYAQYQSNPYGVGYYEYAVNASGTNLAGSAVSGAAATDVYGRFQMASLVAGTYHVASWGVWWRPAHAFNVVMPSVGSPALVDLRLGATMWGYPAFWDEAGYREFGQTFVATGPIAMIYLRCPYSTSYVLSVHEDGPGGPQVGVTRAFGGGDQRPIYGYGEMPTVAGRRYYLRVRTTSAAVEGVVMQMDPRPDFSDPMPGGCLYVGDAGAVTAFPDRDLGVVIMSDDDGLLTNLNARQSGGSWGVTSLGQSFVARGVNLISAAFWLADPAAPTYEVRLYEGGPGGGQVGPGRLGKAARVGADPEMRVIWAPGECPLTPGEVYYLEVRKVGGGVFSAAYVNTGNPYAYGQAYRDGVAVASADVAGTIMEEATSGSATQPAVKVLSGPTVVESDRGTNELTIRWTTDVPAESVVEVAPVNPPYTREVAVNGLVTNHVVTVRGLRGHTMHHYRVLSAASGYRTAVSRDQVICTRASGPNLLGNSGFEEGSGTSPRKPVSRWSTGGTSLDIGASDGTWFWGLPPHSGGWLLEGAVNGSTADGFIRQRVAVLAGKEYTFSAWVGTWMRENNTWKYDVWQDRGRLSWVRLGVDPTGGTDAAAATVQWTPRFYSHRRMSNVAKSVVAASGYLTVFVRMEGQGGEWHLFGVDDCVLTETPAAPPEMGEIVVGDGGEVRVRVQTVGSVATTVEASSDLSNWQVLTNGVSEEGQFEAVDPGPVLEGKRFYRARIP